MRKIVYVVHCVDAEGPMHEPLEDTFLRLSNIFEIEISPTSENLLKLQNCQINLNGKEAAVARLLAPQRLKMKDTWDQIDSMLDKIQTDEFRNRLKDNEGAGWIYSWFCLDHAGFTGLNPRRRDAGFHKVFDHYMRRLPANSRDVVQWHYHPLPATGNYNDSGMAYLNSGNIWELLARKVIERQWFPSVYRPGFHTERPDSHWFLEQWIPFDYGNQSVRTGLVDQPDLAEGRYGDWRRAPKEWIPYHPDHDDYQSKGKCRRWIARCLNMEARLREINVEDVRDAFRQARTNSSSLLAFTNHDFRDMEPEINKIREMIRIVSKEFLDVEFEFTDALTGIRKVTGLEPSFPELECSLNQVDKTKARLDVVSKGKIFGVQPFLAIKLCANKFIWENFDFQGDNSWSFTFDNNHIPFESVEEIGIASNSPYGCVEVIIVDRKGNVNKTSNDANRPSLLTLTADLANGK